jgi:hypothetical protein
VNWFSPRRTLLSIVSRFISRGGRTRAGVGGAGSRLIAALAAASIVFTPQARIRFERDASADAFRAISPVASVVALHSASTHRAAFESRSPSSSDAALPSRASTALLEPFGLRAAIVSVVDWHDTGLLARGYDATAPPTLS